MIENRFVAHGDILGFRKMVLDGDLETLCDRLDRWAAEASKLKSSWSTRCAEHAVEFPLEKLHFSDTVVLWSPPIPNPRSDEGIEISKAFFMALEGLLLLALTDDFPLRMGVAFGPVYLSADKRLIVGKPVIDAYDVEQSQQWIGGAVHPTCPVQAVLRSPHRMLTTYDVPVKHDSQLKLEIAINWSYLALHGRDTAGHRLPYRDQIEAFLTTRLQQQMKKM